MAARKNRVLPVGEMEKDALNKLFRYFIIGW